MKKTYLSIGAIILQTIALGMTLTVKDAKATRPEDRYVVPSRFRKKRGPVPNGARRHLRSYQMPTLIVDRSSSFKKMRRAVNNGFVPLPPTERELMRHRWYRRQKELEARSAAREAWHA